jgi:hypothetical protein
MQRFGQSRVNIASKQAIEPPFKDSTGKQEPAAKATYSKSTAISNTMVQYMIDAFLP